MSAALLADQKSVFEENYNRRSFMFDHTLHHRDLFDLENLVELSKRLPGSYYSTQTAGVGDGWRTQASEPKSLPEAVATIEISNTLVLLKGVADDAEFGPTFRPLFREIVDTVGEPLRSDIAEWRATLVLGSPGRITPYHIDAEVNFLLQLHGEKVVSVFDPADRSLLTDLELEAFYGGDASAATYKTERQREASVFDFRPGKGLHFPILAPHWTRNGDSVSVAISINISLRSNARLANVYKFNNRLRKRGLVPVAPGVSPWQDRLKAVTVEGVVRAKRLRG